jgi:hypothetical protein
MSRQSSCVLPAVLVPSYHSLLQFRSTRRPVDPADRTIPHQSHQIQRTYDDLYVTNCRFVSILPHKCVLSARNIVWHKKLPTPKPLSPRNSVRLVTRFHNLRDPRRSSFQSQPPGQLQDRPGPPRVARLLPQGWHPAPPTPKFSALLSLSLLDHSALPVVLAFALSVSLPTKPVAGGAL